LSSKSWEYRKIVRRVVETGWAQGAKSCAQRGD